MKNFEDMGILEMCKTLGEMGEAMKKEAVPTYADGVRYGAETMAYQAIRIRDRMKDKKSLAGNLWHSEEEIEDAINQEAERISVNAEKKAL